MKGVRGVGEVAADGVGLCFVGVAWRVGMLEGGMGGGEDLRGEN